MADETKRPQRIRPNQVRGYFNATLEDDLKQLGASAIKAGLTYSNMNVTEDGQTEFFTGRIVADGEQTIDFSNTTLLVNGVAQDDADFEVSLYDEDKLKVQWKSSDFMLETQDVVKLVFGLTMKDSSEE